MADTGVAKLPGIPAVNVQDPALRNWMGAVAEHLEVRAGARGNSAERVVTQRELAKIAGSIQYLNSDKPTPKPGDMVVELGGGLTATIAVDAFADAIKNTKLYRTLMTRIDDPDRFSALPRIVQDALLKAISDEAAKRGADIQRMETKLQSAASSLAMTIEEVTASVEGAAAGVRELTFASATATNAVAGKVLQIQARLDGTTIDPKLVIGSPIYATQAALPAVGLPGRYYQVKNPADPAKPLLFIYDKTTGMWYQAGLGNTATIEQVMTATADRVTGTEAQYTLKVSSGGAVAGFGLAATTSAAGTENSSAFIIAADRFAVVEPGDTMTALLGADPANAGRYLWQKKVPFGIDANGIYMSNNVYIKGSVLVDTPYAHVPIYYGMRGSLLLRSMVPSAGWSDAMARYAVWNAVGSGTQPGDNSFIVIGDTVELYTADGTFSETRRWMGNGWAPPGVVINGSLLVDGSVAAKSINTNGLTIKDATGKTIFGSGTTLDWSFVTGVWDSTGTTAAPKTPGLLASQNTVSITGAVDPSTGKPIPGQPTSQVTLMNADGSVSSLNVVDFVNKLSKIGSGNIGNFMENAAIGNAYIGNAAVDTLKIKGQSVVVPFLASSGSSSVSTSAYFLEAGSLLMAIATGTASLVGTFFGVQVTISVTPVTTGSPTVIGLAGASFQNYANVTAQGGYVVPADGSYYVTTTVSRSDGPPTSTFTATSVAVSAFGGRR